MFQVTRSKTFPFQKTEKKRRKQNKTMQTTLEQNKSDDEMIQAQNVCCAVFGDAFRCRPIQTVWKKLGYFNGVR